MDVNQRRSLKIREVVDKLELSEKNEELESVNNQRSSEIISIKNKLLKITEEHKMAMSLNTIHEKAFAHKAIELSQLKKELQSFKVTNQELLQKIQKLETYKTFAKNDSSCRIFCSSA